jgi:hypothetical protein
MSVVRRRSSRRYRKRSAISALSPAFNGARMAKAKWTVMVLMGANNIEGEKDLDAASGDSYAESDLQEMENVGRTTDSHGKPILHIVVQIDRKQERGDGPRRYYINGKREDQGAIPDSDAGSGPTLLAGFLTWARQYPADNYLLVLWGHAYRLAFDRDPKDPEGLDFPKLADVLQSTFEDQSLDIVAFDSCNVSLLEGSYQLRSVAKYMVASQFTDPLPGWPYDEILKRVLHDKNNFTGEEGTKDFGRAIVSQFVRKYTGTDNATMTMLDLSRVTEIRDGVAELARQLATAVDGDQSELDAVTDMFQRSQVPVDQPSVDLVTLCWNLTNFSGSKGLRLAASALGDLLLKPTDPFIVAHARSDLVVAMLHGVSILAPNVVTPSRSVPDSLRSEYDTLDLAQDTLWGELVFALAEPDD